MQPGYHLKGSASDLLRLSRFQASVTNMSGSARDEKDRHFVVPGLSRRISNDEPLDPRSDRPLDVLCASANGK